MMKFFRMSLCLALLLSVTAPAAFAIDREPSPSNGVTEQSLDLWDYVVSVWSKFFPSTDDGTEEAPENLAPTTPEDPTAEEEPDFDPGGGQTEQMPFGDPNG